MPPTRAVALYTVNEKVLCYHGPVMYESKVLDVGHVDPEDKKSPFTYLVHYQGWKSTWDDWVEDDRLCKATPENREHMKQQHQSQKSKMRAETEAKKAKKMSIATVTSKRKSAGGSEIPSSLRASEERSSSMLTPVPNQAPRATKRNRDWDLEKEQDFMTKPSIRIPLPDNLKRMLVDDWEFITKDMNLVPVPHEHPVSEILQEYMSHASPKRRDGSAEADILEEVVQGIREYFDKSLGRILLYRYERQQWHELATAASRDPSDAAAVVTTTVPGVDGGDERTFETNVAGKEPCEMYGAEHLARLFVSMPELIAQTSMDSQSVARLKEEMSLLTKWLAKNSAKYFSAAYHNPGEAYKVKAIGAH